MCTLMDAADRELPVPTGLQFPTPCYSESDVCARVMGQERNDRKPPKHVIPPVDRTRGWRRGSGSQEPIGQRISRGTAALLGWLRAAPAASSGDISNWRRK